MNKIIPRLDEYYQRLDERYVNVFKDNMASYVDDVWAILQRTYVPIGGLFGIASKEQLMDESDFWKMVRLNGKIVAVQVYTQKRGGRKGIYGGTDGSTIGKEAFYKILKDDIRLTDRNMWVEVSGPMERKMLQFGATPIPSKIAQEMLSDKKFLSFDPDGFHYTRVIGGSEVTKIMVGNYQ